MWVVNKLQQDKWQYFINKHVWTKQKPIRGEHDVD